MDIDTMRQVNLLRNRLEYLRNSRAHDPEHEYEVLLMLQMLLHPGYAIASPVRRVCLPSD
jgi:hypothetical protein